MGSTKAIVGAWYKDWEAMESFEVVEVDERHDVIRVQYDNGGFGNIELEQWQLAGYVALDGASLGLCLWEAGEDETSLDEAASEWAYRHTNSDLGYYTGIDMGRRDLR